MEKHHPALVVVTANCIQARKVKNVLLDFRKQKLTQWVTFGDETVPQLMARKMAHHRDYARFEHGARVAISLGRMM
jgi:hypothetical protein